MRFSFWKGPSYNSCKGLFTAGKDLSQFYSAAECFNHPLFSKHSIWTQFQFVIIRAINLSMGDVSKSILSYLSKERQQHIRPWWSRSSLRNRLFWKLSIIMWCYNNRVMWVTIKGKLDFQISRYSLDADLPILGRWLPARWTHLPNTSAKKDIFIYTGFYGPWHPLKTDPWFDKDLWHILTIKTAEYIHITRVHMIAPDSTLLHHQCPTNWGCYHRTIALLWTYEVLFWQTSETNAGCLIQGDFYRTQVYLGSDHWVLVSLSHNPLFKLCKLCKLCKLYKL